MFEYYMNKKLGSGEAIEWVLEHPNYSFAPSSFGKKFLLKLINSLYLAGVGKVEVGGVEEYPWGYRLDTLYIVYRDFNKSIRQVVDKYKPNQIYKFDNVASLWWG